MGTYTELVLKCAVKDDIPKEVDNVLKFLFGRDILMDMPEKLPEHPFFKKISWEAIGRSSSYYHIPCPVNFYNGKYLFTRSDLKNYHEEIESFLDWLIPYLCNSPGKFIGWQFLEQTREPLFIYMPGEDGDT